MSWLDRVRALFGPATAKAAEGMDRRAFIRMFSAGVVGAAAVDVEQLLWMPGQIVPVGLETVKEYTVVDVVSGGNHFVSADIIAQEALRILQQNVAFSKRINRAYDEGWTLDGPTLKVGDRVTFSCSRFT